MFSQINCIPVESGKCTLLRQAAGDTHLPYQFEVFPLYPQQLAGRPGDHGALPGQVVEDRLPERGTHSQSA